MENDSIEGRNYSFIIGVDLLNCSETIINLVDGCIMLNQRITQFRSNPYLNLDICTLEAKEFDWDRIQLSHLNVEEKEGVKKVLKRFKSLFFKAGDQLTNTTAILHEIKTTTDRQINSKLYRYPPQHEAEVRKQIKEM